MKKFKANELLNRDEMKKVAGSGYGGCDTRSCGSYRDGFRYVVVYCKNHWSWGCSCQMPGQPELPC